MPPPGELLLALYKRDDLDATHWGFRLWRLEVHVAGNGPSRGRAVAVFLTMVTKLDDSMVVAVNPMVSVLRTDGGDPGTHIVRGGEYVEFTQAEPRVGWPFVVPLNTIDTFLDSNGDLLVHLTMQRRMATTFTYQLHRSLLVRKEPLETPGFRLAGRRWFLRIFPCGVRGDGATAGLYLVLDDGDAGDGTVVVLKDGWELQYGSTVRRLADVEVTPGTGRGFAKFVELDSIWHLLIRSQEFIAAAVTLADVRVCRPPPWHPDTIGEWLKECLPSKTAVGRMDHELELMAKLIEDNLDYPVKEVIPGGAITTSTALASHMDGVLFVRMKERNFRVSLVPKYKRDAFKVINTGMRDVVWKPSTPRSLRLTTRHGYHVEVVFTCKPPPVPVMDVADTSKRPEEVSPTSGVADASHRPFYHGYLSRQQAVFVLKELKVNYPAAHMFNLRVMILGLKRWALDQQWSDQSPPPPRVLELVCIHVFQTTAVAGRDDVDGLLQAALRALGDWRTLNITWGKKVAAREPPVLLDPADVFFNLAKEVNAMTEYWMVRFARKSLPPPPPPPPPKPKVIRFS